MHTENTVDIKYVYLLLTVATFVWFVFRPLKDPRFLQVICRLSFEGRSEAILKIAFADSIEFTRMIKKQIRCQLFQGAPLDTLTDCLFATKIPRGALVWLETKGIMEVSMLVAIET